MSLRDKLKALEELQHIDLDVGALTAEGAQLPRRREEIEAGLAAARAAYDAEKKRLDTNERERRSAEQVLSMERDKVKKWEGRLGEIRTPREYAALSREIDVSKKVNESQAEQLRTLAAAAGEIQKALEVAADALSEREMAAEVELAELAALEAEHSKRRADLGKRRSEAARKVDPALLARYEKIKRRRAGVAVAPVVGQTCQGCNRNIPPQLFIVLQRAESIETCPNCHRIIYAAGAVSSPDAGPSQG